MKELKDLWRTFWGHPFWDTRLGKVVSVPIGLAYAAGGLALGFIVLGGIGWVLDWLWDRLV